MSLLLLFKGTSGPQSVSFAASGGAVAGGTGQVIKSQALISTGGAVAGGAATVTEVRQPLSVLHIATGGAVAGGEASVTTEGVGTSLTGRLIRGRRRKIDWEELERLSQQQLEAQAAKIVQEELRAEKEQAEVLQKADRENRLNKIKELQKEAEEIEAYQAVLQQEKQAVINKLIQLQEEEELLEILSLI